MSSPTPPTNPPAPTIDQLIATFEAAETQLNTDTASLTTAQSTLVSLQTQQASDLANAQSAVSSAQSVVTTDTAAYQSAAKNLITALQAAIGGGN